MRLLLFLSLSVAAMAQTPTGTLDWGGCGPSYNGHNYGVTCAADVQLSAATGLSEYNVVDLTFYRGKPSQTVGIGFNLKAKDYARGNWYVRLDLLVAAGVTTSSATSTAITTPTTASFTGQHGMFFTGEYKRRITLGYGWRGLSGEAGGKMQNVMVGIRLWAK